MPTMLDINTKAPDFTLKDQSGKNRKLSAYKGHWVLLYFYPKDNTPGCTAQACNLRDDYSTYKDYGIEILGISTDTQLSHEKFAKKHSLPFKILADENKQVVKLYEVYAPKKLFGKEIFGTKRSSYLISPDRIIKKVYPNVDSLKHSAMILKDFAAEFSDSR